jgi:hypothetical protein
MRRQPRPFTVEIKSLRPRSSLAGSLTSSLAVEAFDPPPDDLPVRDVHEDLVQETRRESSPKSEALRQAERIFAGLTAPTPEPSPAPAEPRSPSPVETPRARLSAHPADAGLLEPRAPEAEVRRPRVLPDLTEQARQQEPPALAEPARVKRSSGGTRKPRVRRSSELEAPQAVGSLNPAREPLVSPLGTSDHTLPALLAPVVLSRLSCAIADRGQDQPRPRGPRRLLRSERWRTRRLPRSCWASPAQRRGS